MKETETEVIMKDRGADRHREKDERESESEKSKQRDWWLQLHIETDRDTRLKHVQVAQLKNHASI